MKSEMVKLEHKGLKFKMARPQLAEIAIASVMAASLVPANTAPVSPAPSAVPAIGAEWPGQGGINGGLVAARGDVPAHYLIVGAKDLADHEWGGRGIEVEGLSKTDGHSNTELLIGNEDERKYPAANACAEYQAEGHHDFYLPAAAELYHCWLTCPQVFAKDTWYWSSSQRSAYDVFGMTFGGGYQNGSGKVNELRVRPVRRLFI